MDVLLQCIIHLVFIASYEVECDLSVSGRMDIYGKTVADSVIIVIQEWTKTYKGKLYEKKMCSE